MRYFRGHERANTNKLASYLHWVHVTCSWNACQRNLTHGLSIVIALASLRALSLTDRRLSQGSEDAATQLFRRATKQDIVTSNG